MSTAELKKTLHRRNFGSPGVAQALRKYITENEQRLADRAAP